MTETDSSYKNNEKNIPETTQNELLPRLVMEMFADDVPTTNKVFYGQYLFSNPDKEGLVGTGMKLIFGQKTKGTYYDTILESLCPA